MKKIKILILLLFITGLLYAEDPVVQNVRFVQRTDGSLKADIYYDVIDSDNDTLTVTLEASDDDGLTWELPCSHVSGDVGGSILSGTDKHIVWDFLADNPGVRGSNYRVRVIANDQKEPGMVYINGGSFQMGSEYGEDDELPIHSVTVNGFYIDLYEVTNDLYAAFLNDAIVNDMISVVGTVVKQDTTTLLDFDDPECYITFSENTFQVEQDKKELPVTFVTWFGANAYAEYYNKRLPTEAEWEYASRGGSLSQNYSYSGSNNVDAVAWYQRNSNESPQPVGQLEPNELGLYDMSGNVWEWCADKYDADYYNFTPLTNPNGSFDDLNARVLRGGAWDDAKVKTKPANRNRDYAWQGSNNRGFRCVKANTELTQLNSITISPLDTTVINSGTFQFECLAEYSDGSNVDVTNFTEWSVVFGISGSIESNGLFTASELETGTVQVQAAFDGMDLQTTVNVRFEIIQGAGTVTDIDGNSYQTVKIGTQWWMVENLRVTHYRNGDPIPNIPGADDWMTLQSGALCYYDNDQDTSAVYGALYNWYALIDNRSIAPRGWHVPTEEEWNTLVNLLGDETNAGGSLKESGTVHWQSPNTGASNESGFTGLPGGIRDFDSGFFHIGKMGYFWFKESNSNNPVAKILSYDNNGVTQEGGEPKCGFSVRLIRDQNVNNNPPTASLVVTPETGTTETVFTFDATGSTDDHDQLTQLQVRWDWQDDGIWDTGYSSTKIVTHKFATAISRTVKMQIRDMDGVSSVITKEIRVYQDDLQVTFPNGGETFNTGDTEIIQWFINELDERVYVDLFLGDEFVTRLKDTGTANDGDYTWDISSDIPSGNHYRIRIYGLWSNTTDFSDGYFTIMNQGEEQPTGTVLDNDGNLYKTIKIGEQWWMAENLQVTHYRNGDIIPNVTDNSEWTNLDSGALCYYDNNKTNKNDYGALYNWYAMNDTRNIAPAGWHVPTDTEWKQLEMYLGMSQTDADNENWRGTDQGGKLKETGTSHWNNPNTGATNESGFTARGGGYRSYSFNGAFDGKGQYATFGTATESDAQNTWHHYLYFSTDEVGRGTANKADGFTVRLVKDN